MSLFCGTIPWSWIALLDTNYNHVEDRECALVLLMAVYPPLSSVSDDRYGNEQFNISALPEYLAWTYLFPNSLYAQGTGSSISAGS